MTKVLNTINNMGVSVNKSTGFHCHVDGKYFQFKNVKSLISNFVLLESAFDTCIPTGRRGIRCSMSKSDQVPFGKMTRKQRYERMHSTYDLPNLVSICSPGISS
mmetsp:Transcript_21027/g.34312  ORF Transcript_21027/g.34312 Transcript_21027/m.34312 type:complete len:104 (+) Transcript_21027:829-1140(+)